MSFRFHSNYAIGSYIKRSTLILFFAVLSLSTAEAQNITTQPTALSINGAALPTPKPTALRNFKMPVTEVNGANLEAVSDKTFVFSADTAGSGNKALYYWQSGFGKLINTQESALSGSVIAAEHGRYMVFLYDENDSRIDLNGDGAFQTLLRFYHFSTAQKVNLGIPAKSLKVGTESTFEYRLQNDILSYTRSLTSTNNNFQDNVPWQIMDLRLLLTAIEGTPTPTPSPIQTATPTPPAVTASPTPQPTVPSGLRAKADLNLDGYVNTLDLLLFQYFWQSQPTPTPMPTPAPAG